MKAFFKYLFLLILIPLILIGCSSVNNNDIVLEKTTVFGLEIVEPSGHAKIRFGLIRYFYQKLPTSTNGFIYSPTYSSSVNSTLGFTSQSVIEEFSVGNTNIIK